MSESPGPKVVTGRSRSRRRRSPDERHGPAQGRGRLRSLCQALLARIWIVALCFVGAAILTAGLIEHSPRVYAATAIISIHQSGLAAMEAGERRQAEMKAIESREVLDQVVEVKGLRKLLGRSDGLELSRESAVRALRGLIEVRLRPGTSLVEVSVHNSNPALCEGLANSVAQEYVRQRSRDLDLAKELKIKLVQAAKLPDHPFSPDVKWMFIWGLSAGVAAGVLLAVVLALSQTKEQGAGSRRVKGDGQSARGRKLGLPTDRLTASPPHGPTASPTDPPSDPRSAGSFPSLRAAMGMLARKDMGRTVLFTSAVRGEGRTSCAVAYAESLARQGLKAILIDLDPDSSGLDRLLNATVSDRPGVGDVLSGRKAVREVIQEVGHEALPYIAAGSVAADLVELLARGGFPALLQELLSGGFYRVVVISPPLLPVNAIRVLVPQMQAVCLVLRTRQTSRRIAGRVIHTLRRSGAPPPWVVFNREGVVTVIRDRK